MKKFSIIIILLATTASSFSINIVQKDSSDYTIYLNKSASISEKYAAEELQKFIEKISDVKLKIVQEAKKDDKLIILGKSNLLDSYDLKIDYDYLGDDGFVIKTVGDDLVIAGGRLRGTLYGVYTFLEDVLGCRWYSSDCSYIPQMGKISFEKIDIQQKPDFEYREPEYTDAWDGDWAARNKTNGSFARLKEKHGGKFECAPRYCHTFYMLVPPDKYFDDHPEYYALIDGEREPCTSTFSQLCLTNPDIVDITVNEIFRLKAQDPGIKLISVSQNDYHGSCQCKKCLAVDRQEGSPSGKLLRFVNKVAKKVKEKHPEVLIMTLAYQHTEKPPEITRPAENVRIQLCPISVCQYHRYDNCDYPYNLAFMENLKQWSAITDDLYIWHYSTLYFYLLCPLPDLHQIPASIKMYKDNAIKGILVEGNHVGRYGFMDELKAYLIAKLLWNSDADSEIIIDDFLWGYYGRAAGVVKEYIRLLHDQAKNRNLHGSCWPGQDYVVLTEADERPQWPYPYIPLLTDDVVYKSKILLKQAHDLVKNDSARRTRIEHMMLGIECYEIFQKVQKVRQIPNKKIKDELKQQVQEFFNKCIKYNTGQIYFYRKPDIIKNWIYDQLK